MLVVWYNNGDIVPFVEALEKQSSVFGEKRIDMLKLAFPSPWLAVRWLFAVVGKTSVHHSISTNHQGRQPPKSHQ